MSLTRMLSSSILDHTTPPLGTLRQNHTPLSDVQTHAAQASSLKLHHPPRLHTKEDRIRVPHLTVHILEAKRMKMTCTDPHQPEKSKVAPAKTQIHICIQGIFSWGFLMYWKSVTMPRMCYKREETALAMANHFYPFFLSTGDEDWAESI